jgi:hypothetical protein
LSAPTQVINDLYPISNNQVVVSLPWFGPSDAYTVRMIANTRMFYDGFESGNFTAGGWSNSGCDLQTTYKYAGSRAGRFNYSDSLTKSLSTAGYQNIQIRYARYTRQCETDDHFIAEWYNGSVWTTLENLTGNSAWAIKTYSLPSEANNNTSLQIRFRTSHNGSSDYGYLDEVKIVGEVMP